MCKNFIFFISFVLALALVPTNVARGLDPDCVALWMLDETSGTVAYDSSDFGNNGTLVGNPQWVAGQIDGALQFDGTGDWVNCGNPASLTINNAITLACWVKAPPWTKTWETILAKGDDSYRLSRSGSGNAGHFGCNGVTGSSGNPYFDGTVVIADNTWHHFAGTYNGTNMIIYVDGDEDSRQGATGQINTSSYNFYIGENAQATGREITGTIDDVRIYRRALTEAEIEVIMLGEILTKARNPNPADGAIGVSVEANLTWTRGDGADEDEVYFGTDPCALPKVADIIVLPINPPFYNPGDPNLIASTTYYWRVDEINDMNPITGDLWSFTTVRGEAQPEYPVDGGLINGDIVSGNISTNLEFFPGATTVEYTGYFNEDYVKVATRHPDANLGPPPYGYLKGYEYTYWVGNPGVPPFTDSLVRGTKYYWTVDCKDAKGNTYDGDVWEFAIYGYYAFAPSPPNEAVLVSPDVLLSWLPGFTVEDHDVYMGTNWEDVNNAEYDPFNPPPEFLETRSEPNYQCSGLETNTKYYWRVDEVVGRGPPLFIPDEFYKGNVWCFTTGLPGGGLLGEYYHHTGEASPAGFETFVVERIDPVIDFGWGEGQPHPLVNADDFSIRWRGKVGVPYSGLITFYAASDDGARLWVDDMTTPIIDAWVDRGETESAAQPMYLDAGYYDIKMEMYENGGGAAARLRWSSAQIPKGIIPSEYLVPFIQLWAHDPDPMDGQSSLPTSYELRWGPGKYAAQHDVYLGTDKAAVESATTSTPGIYKGRIGPNSLGPLAFDAATLYYWRIDEVNLAGPDPCVWKGDTWIFRTVGAAGGLLGLYYHWDGILPPQGPLPYAPGPANAFQIFVMSRIDPEVNFSWGDPGSPDPNVNVDDFGCRWVGHVECPIDANYTFYTTTDDGARLFIDGIKMPLVDPANPTHDSWQQQGDTEYGASIVLSAGLHDIEMHMYERAGGATAQLRWSAIPTNPSDDSIMKQIIPPIWLWPPLFASGPRPPDGATIDDRTPALEWIAGVNAVYHELYFSANFDDVNNRNPAVREIVSDPCRPYPAGPRLELGKTYYWLVDEVKSVSERWNARTVWSFTISECLSLDNMEDYNDRGELRQVWRDGNADVVWGGIYPYLYLVQGGSSGSNLNVSTAVGSPFQPGTGPVPPTPLNYEAMVLRYDNDGETYTGLPGEEEWVYDAPYYSEIEANTVGDNSLDVGQTWDSEGAKSLSLSFQGHPISDGYYDPLLWPTYTQYSRGRDIWGRHDEFFYLSKYPFIGDGSVQVQVLSMDNTDPWAKAGVMIREKWTPYSKYAAVFITPGNGVTFQYRDVEDGPTTSITKPGVTAPQYVRLVRNISGAFEAKHSANGFVWDDVNAPNTEPVFPEIPMGTIDDPNIYAGTAATSHNANQICATDFNDLLLSPLPANWVFGNIGTNDPEQLYVALSDGVNTSVIEHNDVNAATLTTWQEWNIKLSDFSTVNLDAIKKVYIGLGDRDVPVQGGSGAIYVDDIRACPPRCIPALAKPVYDIAQPYDCIVDEKDIGVWAADYLESGFAVEDVWTTGVWTSADIGDVCTPGSFSDLGSDTFEITATGADIWGTSDEFHYAFKPLTGDGQITVRVVSILPDPPLNEWSKAGVMIRDTLDPNSAHAFIAVTPNYQPDGTGPQGHRISAQGRVTAGGTSFNVDAGNMTGPQCIRLMRQGDTFTAYYYDNGEWIELASTDIVMTDPVYIGMAVTAHEDSGPLATAAFDRACSNTFLPTDTYSDFIVNLKDYALIADKYLEQILWPTTP